MGIVEGCEVIQNQPSSKIILVDGANGYIGTHVVYALCKMGYDVRALIRESAQDSEGLLQSFGAKVYRASLDSSSVSAAFDGVHTVVHLIGSIAPKKGETLDQLHAGMTEKLVKVCKDSSVKRIIMVSALGTKDDALSQYHKTKRLAERVIESSGIDYVILRPSLVVGLLIGRRESKLVKRYRDMISSGTKRIPLIGGGRNKLQPVYVADLASAVIECVESPQLNGSRLEIAGKEVITMKTLIEMLMKVEGKDLNIVNVSPGFMKVVASVLEKVMEVPIVSGDQVVLSSLDNISNKNDLIETLNIAPTPLKEALSSYTHPDMLDCWNASLGGRKAEGVVNS